jgi:hypothetical protein
LFTPTARTRRHATRLLIPLIVALSMLAVAPAAQAATTYSTTALSATVSGSSVTTSTTIKASVGTSASLAGVCARSASGAHYDFPLRAATVSTSGTSFTTSRSFPAGTYTYQACAKVGGVWNNIGSSKTFTVSGTSAASSATASGVPMPVGNLPGWKQVFTDDFSTNVSAGSFPGPYASKWTGYDGFPDSSGYGRYDMDILSVSGGALDMNLHTSGGQPLVAAPSPIVTGKYKGQSYGRFTIRFKSDALDGYKAAWMLWPDSDNWNTGEINFPEGGLDGDMFAFNHCIGNPAKNCYWFDSDIPFSGGWHTVTVEWTPGKIVFTVDGKSGSTTSSVPTVPLHWLLQTETEGRKPASDAAGHIKIDWVAIYTYAP